MLFKTAFRNLKKSPLMNMISFLQLVAVLLITGVMVSSLCIRYRLYTPFADLIQKSGYFATFSNGANRGNGTGERFWYADSDEFAEEIGAESVLSTYDLITYTQWGDGVPAPRLLSYDDEIIKRYKPRLKEGRWLSANSDEIEAVVSESSFGLRVGDVAEIALVIGNAAEWELKSFNVRIIGVLDEGAEVYGMISDFDGASNTYRQLFRSFYPDREETSVMLFSHSVLSRFECATSITQAFITYDETTYDKAAAMEQIRKAGGSSVSLDKMYENSHAYLQEELLKLLPIVIVLMILVLVSGVSISALSTRRRLKDYAKYYVVGLRWGQCVLVNLFQSLITAVAAAAASAAVLFVAQYTALADLFMIFWNGWVVLAMIGVTVLYLLFSMIMPTIMLKSVTPKQLLTAE